MCDSFKVIVWQGRVVEITVHPATPTCEVVQIIEDIEGIVENLPHVLSHGGMS